MNNQQTNPASIFYKNYEKQILTVRKELLSKVGQISKEFESEAKKILERKLETNGGNPLLGEMFPWIISDLVNGKRAETKKVSVAWLAIYLYTIFLDDYIDDPEPLSSAKFMTASILAQIGLLNIGRLTYKTEYEKEVAKAFSFAARNQGLDIKFQSVISKESVKAKYSRDKNYLVIACAGAMAAQNGRFGKSIMRFSESLLLALQYLDDIADYKSDFRSGNITVLINHALRNDLLPGLEIENTSDRELLRHLVATGAFQRVTKKLITLLDQAITIVETDSDLKSTQSTTIAFFISLRSNIMNFNSFLRKNQKDFASFDMIKQNVILDQVEKIIPLVAQST